MKADRERVWLLEAEKRLENEDMKDYSLNDIHSRLREIESEKAVPRAKSILCGLGFNAKDIESKPSKEYSGGWRMRLALARALFMRPALLILDEPTNHLDIQASVWLENYLKSYEYSLLLVSHDQILLDEVVTNIIHFDQQKLVKYKGNYSSFRKQYPASSKKENINFIAPKPLTDSALITFTDVSFGYDASLLFKDLNFGIYSDSKIGLVGPNGIGKSSLLNIILGNVEYQGSVYVNRHMRIGYFCQHQIDNLNLNSTCLEYLSSIRDLNVAEQRKLLGRFGLVGATPLQKIASLSGGQKSRLVFASIAMVEPHLLLLDEPSNHLDIETISTLIESLQEYKGGLVIISHPV